MPEGVQLFAQQTDSGFNVIIPTEALDALPEQDKARLAALQQRFGGVGVPDQVELVDPSGQAISATSLRLNQKQLPLFMEALGQAGLPAERIVDIDQAGIKVQEGPNGLQKFFGATGSLANGVGVPGLISGGVPNQAGGVITKAIGEAL